MQRIIALKRPSRPHFYLCEKHCEIIDANETIEVKKTYIALQKGRINKENEGVAMCLYLKCMCISFEASVWVVR